VGVPQHSYRQIAVPGRLAGWTKDVFAPTEMFRLYPPNVLPSEAKVVAQPIEFPAHSEVQVIRQLEFHGGQL
jgi:hypothetical protein